MPPTETVTPAEAQRPPLAGENPPANAAITSLRSARAARNLPDPAGALRVGDRVLVAQPRGKAGGPMRGAIRHIDAQIVIITPDGMPYGRTATRDRVLRKVW